MIHRKSKLKAAENFQVDFKAKNDTIVILNSNLKKKKRSFIKRNSNFILFTQEKKKRIFYRNAFLIVYSSFSKILGPFNISWS